MRPLVQGSCSMVFGLMCLPVYGCMVMAKGHGFMNSLYQELWSQCCMVRMSCMVSWMCNPAKHHCTGLCCTGLGHWIWKCLGSAPVPAWPVQISSTLPATWPVWGGAGYGCELAWSNDVGVLAFNTLGFMIFAGCAFKMGPTVYESCIA